MFILETGILPKNIECGHTLPSLIHFWGGMEIDPNKPRGSTVCLNKCRCTITKIKQKQKIKQYKIKLDSYYTLNLFNVFSDIKTNSYVVKLNFVCNYLKLKKPK